MPWFGIRNVYLFGTKSDGTNIFEERIVVFEGKDEHEAHRKASDESEAYALENGFECHPHQYGYEQDGDPLIDGYEVFSAMYESKGTLDEFYQRFYTAREYTPEERIQGEIAP